MDPTADAAVKQSRCDDESGISGALKSLGRLTHCHPKVLQHNWNFILSQATKIEINQVDKGLRFAIINVNLSEVVGGGGEAAQGAEGASDLRGRRREDLR